MSRYGAQRLNHKYTKRQWNIQRQEWDYTYPEDMVLPSEENGYDTDLERNAMRFRGGQNYQEQKEEALATEINKLRPRKGKSDPDLGDKKDDEQFLEGFEEGYKLAKEVDRAEVKKSLVVRVR